MYSQPKRQIRPEDPNRIMIANDQQRSFANRQSFHQRIPSHVRFFGFPEHCCMAVRWKFRPSTLERSVKGQTTHQNGHTVPNNSYRF